MIVSCCYFLGLVSEYALHVLIFFVIWAGVVEPRCSIFWLVNIQLIVWYPFRFIKGDFNRYVAQIRNFHVSGGENELLNSSHILLWVRFLSNLYCVFVPMSFWALIYMYFLIRCLINYLERWRDNFILFFYFVIFWWNIHWLLAILLIYDDKYWKKWMCLENVFSG